MGVKELCYKIEEIPDLSLNKYASLEGNGVNGVLEKHLAFLRQWNRKGVLSGSSIHLYYYYDGQKEDGTYAVGVKGSKLKILFVVRGDEEKMNNVPQLVSASTLADYFKFTPCTFESFLKECSLTGTSFSVCSTLIKEEVFVKSSLEITDENVGYYTVPQWEMNEDGRLYNMFKLMESLDKQMLYRIDLYPVEKSNVLRNALRKPTAILHERQYSKAGITGQRDFEAENVLKSYEDLLNSVNSSPHFIVNIFVLGNDRENSAVVLDAAGAEALMKGNYEICTFSGKFTLQAFLDNEFVDCYDRRKKVVMRKGQTGLIICKEESQNYKLNFLPTLFTLEEAAPFFRFPALYEGEVIQRRKETAPKAVSAEEGLFLGTDDNGYDVYFPLKNLAKHAFIAGVPGSGKTNTMHHLTSTLWKKHHIPFLVLEPAKQEYRALVNQKGMEDVYVFSPNADMVLNNIENMVRIMGENEDKTKIPSAIIFTKSDLLQGIAEGMYQADDAKVCLTKNGCLDADMVKETSRNIINYLEKTPGIVEDISDQIGNIFENKNYFSIAAYGVKVDQEERPIAPYGIALPFLWTMASFGDLSIERKRVEVKQSFLKKLCGKPGDVIVSYVNCGMTDLCQ